MRQLQINQFEDLLQAEMKVTMGSQSIFVSVYLIDNLLIDTGPMRKEKELIPLFKQWQMEQAIITHHHEDHSGLGKWVQENKQIPIYMHEKGKEICKKSLSIPLYRRLFWGKRDPFIAKPIDEVFQTENYTWDIIYTPGHAEDHIALYNREKGWMFGGDLYVYPRPRSMYAFESLPIMVASLEKILTYDFTTYICMHAGVLKEGRKKIQEKLDHLRQAEQNIIKLHEKGFSPKEIRKQLFPKRQMMHYISFFESSPMHIIYSVLNNDKK